VVATTKEDAMSTQIEAVSRAATMPQVVSRDGTKIAYWTSGDGPPLLIVHGTSGSHERFAPLLPFLEPHATVHAMDRRGRGGSGDAPEYDLQREFEDVAAAVDAIAAASGAKVDVYGHSYGGECAFGAALLTSNIRSLVLYEGWPPVMPEKLKFPIGVEERLDALVTSGDREAALELFWREVVKVSEEDIRVIRAQPTWPSRVATVHTITREFRAFFKDAFDPERAARITVPVLLLAGTDTPEELRDDPETVAAALPDARIAVLEGQQHIADVLAPELFAEPVLEFLRRRP
jgi:pimeloyl-ACP methyl ester carboxylesterase